MTELRPTGCAGVALRAFDESDLEFLYAVYAASRADEMAVLMDWSQAQKTAFLRFQFEAQHAHYQTHYPDARYDVIVRAGEAIGRLYVARLRNEIRIMDIALLPAHRRQGIGRALVQEILDEAGRERKLVSLHVEEHNPARRLYAGMGFVDAGEVGVYRLMHWVPPGLVPVPAAGGPTGPPLS